MGVLREGTVIAAAGIASGVVGGLVLTRVAGGFLPDLRVPGAAAVIGAATVLVSAAIVASLVPAARASKVDVMRALRDE